MKKSKLFILSALALSVAVSVSGCGLNNVKKPKRYAYSGGVCHTKSQCILFESQAIWNERNNIANKYINGFYGIRGRDRKIAEFIEYRKNETFGYSKHMLKQVALNKTDAHQYLPQVLANDMFSFVNGFKAFNETTRNRGMLDSMVYGYFANSLTSNYGEIKTSFLRNIGVGIETNITYTTILKNANDFLKTVKYNDKYIFNSLFNKNFGRKHLVVTSSEPAGIVILKAFSGGGSFNGGIHIHRNYQPYISLLRYYPPSLNNINFYSLVYYLFKEINYGHGKRKRIAEKILADIILRRFNNARRILHRNFKQPKHNSNLKDLERIEAMSYMFVTDAEINHPQIPSCYHNNVSLKNYKMTLPRVSKCGANLKIVVPYPVTKKQIANLESLKDSIDTEISRYDGNSETGELHMIALDLGSIIKSYKKIRIYFDWFDKFKTKQYWKNPIER